MLFFAALCRFHVQRMVIHSGQTSNRGRKKKSASETIVFVRKKKPLFEQWTITDRGQRERIRLDTHWEGTSAAGLRCLCHFPHQRIVIASICIWLVDVSRIFDTHKKRLNGMKRWWSLMICIFIWVCIFATVVYTLFYNQGRDLGPIKTTDLRPTLRPIFMDISNPLGFNFGDMGGTWG